MSTSSIAELAKDVCSVRLGVTDIMKEPTAKLRGRVERLYNQKHAELSLKDKAYWPLNEIPEIMVGALSRIIAEEMCPGLGLQIPTEPDENGTTVSMGTKGWRMLRRLLAEARTGAETRSEYF